MSLYETIWKDERNRTILITSILSITCLIFAILFASIDQTSAPEWIKGFYPDLNSVDLPYKAGLTIIEFLLMSGFYFFFLIAIATYSELRAKLPSWGIIVISAVISLLITWFITSIHPAGPALPTNFTTGMQWTVFGVLLAVIILSVVYIFFTEAPDEEKSN
ncbi:MAG: hypothetical protein H7645_03570 [Candidatus Heimdallarchaeota archaeon]|nr:hypothetical protein [Candidatus Heimdallarchaeota archaeon]MCK4769394.1 hypothetical protein [Candidatus Heimdallarchaeota archaeon]